MLSGGVDVGRLRSFVERIERLEEEIASLNSDKADVYESASADFDKKALKIVVRRRRMDRNSLESEDFLVQQYEWALGPDAAPEPPVARNDAAYSAGYDDGYDNSRDHALDWAPGTPGHADYEMGVDAGHAARVDESLPPATPSSRARTRRREETPA